jgi:hypothetical protein
MTFLSEPLSLPHKLFLVVIGGLILIYDFFEGGFDNAVRK